jgi:hypothetical protein
MADVSAFSGCGIAGVLEFHVPATGPGPSTAREGGDHLRDPVAGQPTASTSDPGHDALTGPGVEDVRRTVAALAHRGPHGSGIWHRPGLVLGHCRLAVLGLAHDA